MRRVGRATTEGEAIRGLGVSAGRVALAAGGLLGVAGAASGDGIQGTYKIVNIDSRVEHSGQPHIDDAGNVGWTVGQSAGPVTDYSYGSLNLPGREDIVTGSYLKRVGSDVNLLPLKIRNIPFGISGINAGGRVVGYSRLLETAGSYGAYYFSPGLSGPIAVKGFAGELVARELSAINDRDEIVGVSAGRAALWNGPLSLPVDLNTLISPNSGWALYSASGINNRGEIVGFGLGSV